VTTAAEPEAARAADPVAGPEVVTAAVAEEEVVVAAEEAAAVAVTADFARTSVIKDRTGRRANSPPGLFFNHTYCTR
jgi:hypothetical protein